MPMIDDLGVLAISTRLQKLSDALRKDCSMIYRQHGIAFEARWFPVVYVLSKKSPLGIVELAGELGYAHPSIITLVRELEKQKLVRSKPDAADKRKRRITLTPEALRLLEQMQPVWQKMIAAVKDLLDTQNNLFKAIVEVEERLKSRSLCDRISKS